MHVVHLGCDLWLVGNALKTILIDTELWGSGHDDERLLNGWLEFKAWARQNKWQPLVQIQSGKYIISPLLQSKVTIWGGILKGNVVSNYLDDFNPLELNLKLKIIPY